MIHFVIGTRAQMFKMAPIMRECQKRNLEWRWIYVAQHKETMDETVKTFGLPPADYTVLDWETEANTIPKYAYWMTRSFLQVFKGKKTLAGYKGKKHVVLTHGDTTSTVWGALLGKIHRCKVMHVESGLRSFNLMEPFPEEINRLITFRLTDIYASPGDWAANNVKKYRGVKLNTIENTQADTIAFGLENSDKAKIKIPKQKYVVATIHRYENIFKEEKFKKIIELLELIAQDYRIEFVRHPVTQNQLKKFGYDKRLEKNKNIDMLPRLEYLPFIKLVKGSEFCITDGGGTQEELYHMGKPTLLFRNETERQEGIGKTALMSKFDEDTIKDFVINYKKYQQNPTALKVSPSEIIVDKLEEMGFSNK